MGTFFKLELTSSILAYIVMNPMHNVQMYISDVPFLGLDRITNRRPTSSSWATFTAQRSYRLDAVPGQGTKKAVLIDKASLKGVFTFFDVEHMGCPKSLDSMIFLWAECKQKLPKWQDLSTQSNLSSKLWEKLKSLWSSWCGEECH